MGGDEKNMERSSGQRALFYDGQSFGLIPLSLVQSVDVELGGLDPLIKVSIKGSSSGGLVCRARELDQDNRFNRVPSRGTCRRARLDDKTTRKRRRATLRAGTWTKGQQKRRESAQRLVNLYVYQTSIASVVNGVDRDSCFSTIRIKRSANETTSYGV